jgi:glycosyltransferase involved in cell wall biosynthesis
MTDRYAALLSPIFRVMRKSQSLWYAHAHRSFGLNFSKMFVDRILSSTYGSLRVHSKNTELLGQMVNHEHFEPPTRPREDISKFLIVGRLDPSKNVPLLLKTFNSWRLDHPWTKLLIVGSPSSPESGLIIRKELTKYENMVSSGAVNLLPFVQRHDLADIYRAHDIFLHAFDGSLDKTLIEATLTCLPVVTLNREYIAEFGSWGEDPSSLFGEIDSIYRMPKSALKAELVRRRKIAIERHSEEQWVKKMARILLT